MTAWRRRLDPLPARALPGGLVLHVADGPLSRLRGLARLDELPEERGLLLTRTKSVHTLGMRFALDVVWLDRRGAVVRVDHDVQPRKHAACAGARSVVEVRSGSGDRFAAALSSQVPVQRARPSS
ncbi:DUF192 domain-containing protein [Svornostia abyssi]|uniref:DUF192 domain-containing protein n=1 Tax=Svornostia abyssi TaxID=2898438 RepID=A0ABY5PCF9_9ACTN|nr:DUF192 domain-containing protein [Parviterribacteraceae bacterium J379]